MNWNPYFFGIAEAVSKKSHCLSHKFGAIAVRDNHILSTGYNGPPSGYPHCTGDVCPRRKIGFQSGQGLEICPAAHAEMNVLIQAARFGVALDRASLYIYGPTPCRECAKAIVNAGIRAIFVLPGFVYPDIGLTGITILNECRVKLIASGEHPDEFTATVLP